MDYNSAFAMTPKLVRVGNSCYRRLDCDYDGVIDDITIDSRKFSIQQQTANNYRKNYSIDQIENENYSYEDNYDNNDHEFQLDDGEELFFDENSKRFILKIHLCNIFFGVIIGKKAQTKINIENETKTMIKIPKINHYHQQQNNVNLNFIQISGINKSNIYNAYRRIRDIEYNIRLKQRLTHFLSIPISYEIEIKKRFLEFKNTILSDPKLSTTKSIDEYCFQSEHRLHLTLRIFYLGDEFERKKAIKYLQNFYQLELKTILNDNKKILLHMKGIDIMNDDPMEANILYAKVFETDETNDLFRTIINKLYDYYNDFTDLQCETNDQYETINNEWKIKIHCTLMNIRYRENKFSTTTNNNEQQQKKKYQQKMNVTNILNKFNNYDFGKFYLNQIHLSTIDFYDEKNNNYYLPLYKIYF